MTIQPREISSKDILENRFSGHLNTDKDNKITLSFDKSSSLLSKNMI